MLGNLWTECPGCGWRVGSPGQKLVAIRIALVRFYDWHKPVLKIRLNKLIFVFFLFRLVSSPVDESFWPFRKIPDIALFLFNPRIVTMESVLGTNFTSAKLVFYSVFWSVHIGLFAAGWCVLNLIFM